MTKLDKENFFIQCEYIDYARHLVKGHNSQNYEYFVSSVFDNTPNIHSFNVMEMPVIIQNKQKIIYRNTDFFGKDWEIHHISSKLKELEEY